MKTLIREAIVALIVIVALAGCSRHGLMRGSVVMALDDEYHVCLGSQDQIEVGDVLTVYRTENKKTGTVGKLGGKGIYPVKIRAGKAVVTKVLNEHYCVVKLTEGEIKEGYIIEKN